MKSCSICYVLLFITVSGLNASPFQVQPGKAAGTPAATQQDSGSARVPAVSAMNNSSTSGAVSAIPPAIAKPRVLPLGSTLVAEFSGSLNAKNLKLGEKVKAKLAQDLISGGTLVAKSGSKLLGHVTEVKRHAKDHPESRLGIVFDKILVEKHREIDFQAIVLALAPPVLRRSRVDEPDQMLPPAVPSPSGGSGPVGGNRSGHSVSSMTTLSSSVVTLGPYATVQSTPGSNPGGSVDNPQTGSSRGATPISGGVGMHGVYGLKDLALAPPAPGVNSGPAIISTRSDVKLQNGTQVVILVVN